MKITPSASNSLSKRAPLLPLIPDPLDKMDHENTCSFLLRTEPADANSPTFKKYIRVLSGNESIRTVLKWGKDSMQVLRGLNL